MASRSRTSSAAGGGGGKRDAFAVMMESARSGKVFENASKGNEPSRTPPRHFTLWESHRRPPALVYIFAGVAVALLALSALENDRARETPLGLSPTAVRSEGTASGGSNGGGGGLLRSIFSFSSSAARSAEIEMTEDGFASASGTGGSDNPFWIVFAAQDGLGDQIFQYASSIGMMLSNSGTKFARSRQLRVCTFVKPEEPGKGGVVHSAFYPAEVFEGPLTSQCPGGVPAAACGAKIKCPLAHREKGYGLYTPLTLDRDKKYNAAESKGALVGKSLQSYKYFAQFEDRLREHLVLKQELRDEALRELKELAGGHSARITTVGIHLRKDAGQGRAGGGLAFPPKEYFVEAMRRLQTQAKAENPDGRVVFVVLGPYQDVDIFRSHMEPESDLMDPDEGNSLLDSTSDMVYVYTERGTNSQNFMDHSTGGGVGAGRDMALLASCDHVITTLGAFGWWAGWLSKGTVVYYRDQFDLEHPAQREMVNPDDYFPPKWVGIGAGELAGK